MDGLAHIELQLEKVSQLFHISADVIRGSHFDILDDYIVRMGRKVATWRPETEDIIVPATWWDHWKVDHAKSLLFFAFVEAHPPKYRTYNAAGMLPDFPVPVSSDSRFLVIPYWHERYDDV